MKVKGGGGFASRNQLVPADRPLHSSGGLGKPEVKVGDIVIFGVVNGLRQGCVLSLVLFSLYV